MGNVDTIFGAILKDAVLQDRSIPYIIGLVLLLAVAVILFVAFPSLFTAQPSGSPPPGTSQTPSETPQNLSSAQTSLLSRAKLNFPAISTARAVKTTDLPADLRWVIILDTTGVVVQAVTYKDQRSGFIVTLRAPLPLLSVYAKYFGVLEKLSGWERDTGLRLDLFGLLEYHNARWQARLTIADVNSRYAQVVLQALRK